MYVTCTHDSGQTYCLINVCRETNGGWMSAGEQYTGSQLVRNLENI